MGKALKGFLYWYVKAYSAGSSAKDFWFSVFFLKPGLGAIASRRLRVYGFLMHRITEMVRPQAMERFPGSFGKMEM